MFKELIVWRGKQIPANISDLNCGKRLRIYFTRVNQIEKYYQKTSWTYFFPIKNKERAPGVKLFWNDEINWLKFLLFFLIGKVAVFVNEFW